MTALKALTGLRQRLLGAERELADAAIGLEIVKLHRHLRGLCLSNAAQQNAGKGQRHQRRGGQEIKHIVSLRFHGSEM